MCFLLAVITLLFASPADAGGPLSSAFGRGVIYRPDSMPIPYIVDQGALGLFDNAQAVALVDACFAVWQAVPTANISFSNTGILPTDVTGANYFSYFSSDDGINPVLFDSDGSIVDAVFGVGARNSVIGFAGSEFDPATGYYTEGLAVLNGRFSEAFSAEQFKATFVHEFGHFIGLDHCQINTQFAGDDNTANDIYLPTMFPTATDDDTPLADLNPDDLAALTLLYPADPGVVSAAYGKIHGTVTWRSGMPVLGANVVAYKLGDEQMSRFSSVSDYYLQNTGAFEMLVTPGTYRLYIEPVNRAFTGGSSVGPYALTLLSPSFTKPVKTAYYPLEISVGAGETVGGIDIIARPSAGGLCPAEVLLGAQHPATDTLRRFRDTVLTSSPEGRSCARLYDMHSTEINKLLASHPDLRRACRQVLLRLALDIQAVMSGHRSCISPKLLADIESLCARFRQTASPALQRAIADAERTAETIFDAGLAPAPTTAGY